MCYFEKERLKLICFGTYCKVTILFKVVGSEGIFGFITLALAQVYSFFFTFFSSVTLLWHRYFLAYIFFHPSSVTGIVHHIHILALAQVSSYYGGIEGIGH